AGGCASLNTLTGGVRGASCNEARGRQPGIKTAPDRGLTWARALHSFAQLRQNRQNHLLFGGPIRKFEKQRVLALRLSNSKRPRNFRAIEFFSFEKATESALPSSPHGGAARGSSV